TFDAFVINVPDNVPVQVKNLHLEYKDTFEKSKEAAAAKGLTQEQQKLLDLEKAMDNAKEKLDSTPATHRGAGNEPVDNPNYEPARQAYVAANKAYEDQKAKMISTAKTEAAASMTKKYIDAVQGNIKASLRMFG